MFLTGTHFNYYLSSPCKLSLFASVRYVFKPVETVSFVPTALIKSGDDDVLPIFCPWRDNKNDYYINNQFLVEGIMFSSYCDAEIFGIACPVRDRIPVEK